LDDSGAIFRYHRNMIALHGSASSYALGWRDQESQAIRFRALAAIANLNDRTILDAGCGYGNLLPYLSNLYQLAHYTGIEQIPELLDNAISLYGHLPRTTFISGNFLEGGLPVADYVLACGSLNYGSTDPGFIYQAISHLYQHCSRGFGFNLLRTVPAGGYLAAYDPQNIEQYCHTLTKQVVLKTDYAKEDFTIFLYR